MHEFFNRRLKKCKLRACLNLLKFERKGAKKTIFIILRRKLVNQRLFFSLNPAVCLQTCALFFNQFIFKPLHLCVTKFLYLIFKQALGGKHCISVYKCAQICFYRIFAYICTRKHGNYAKAFARKPFFVA